MCTLALLFNVHLPKSLFMLWRRRHCSALGLFNLWTRLIWWWWSWWRPNMESKLRPRWSWGREGALHYVGEKERAAIGFVHLLSMAMPIIYLIWMKKTPSLPIWHVTPTHAVSNIHKLQPILGILIFCSKNIRTSFSPLKNVRKKSLKYFQHCVVYSSSNKAENFY